MFVIYKKPSHAKQKKIQQQMLIFNLMLTIRQECLLTVSHVQEWREKKERKKFPHVYARSLKLAEISLQCERRWIYAM